MGSGHVPVMLREVLEALVPVVGGRYVDGTIGEGGHARALLDRIGPRGTVLGLDQDPDVIDRLRRTMGDTASNLILRRSNFSRLEEVLSDLGWEAIDGMILDLGIGTHQLEGSGRGFSFNLDEPLDMRMDPDAGPPASQLVNRMPEPRLADLIYEYGEEHGSRRVARAIARERQKRRIETSAHLADVVRRALSRPGRPPRIDPATRTFQALRVAVNRETEHLDRILAEAPRLIRPGGRAVFLSFHSLEDRRVKLALRRGRRADADHTGPALRALYKKPLRPSPEETDENPRARSAKLRAGERVG